jgi:hypothetical protein
MLLRYNPIIVQLVFELQRPESKLLTAANSNKIELLLTRYEQLII